MPWWGWALVGAGAWTVLLAVILVVLVWWVNRGLQDLPDM